MNLEERLNEIIETKDSEIESLQNKIEKMEGERDLERLKWQAHQHFENDSFSVQMPHPRIEMRLERVSRNPDDWYMIQWVYGLVYKHMADLTNDTLLFIPLGCTTSSGGKGTFESRYHEGKLDVPFRDGLHILTEASLFGLPAFITCKEKGVIQELDITKHAEGFVSQMKSAKL